MFSSLTKSAQRLASTVTVSALRPGVQVLSLNRAPVNSITRDFMQDIIGAVKEVEANPENRAFILTSSITGIFSAGLHVPAIYGKTRAELDDFYRSLQDMWFTLHDTPLSTVAAINGHAPAGGCVLAIACDERIMVDGKYVIGLNETELGIVPPPWIIGNYRAIIGAREADRLIQQGKLMPPKEALRLGLVDELVETEDELMDASLKRLEPYLMVNDSSRAFTKMLSREHFTDLLTKNRDADADRFVSKLASDEIQAILGKFIANLEKKRQQKK